MVNPVNSSVYDGTSANTTPSNPINDPGVENRQGLNTFDLSAQNAFTARYGEITPFFYGVGVPDDRTTLKPSHMLRTYTFGSPLLSTMRMHVQNFSVPLSAIMPNTWDLIYKNPVKGVDVPDAALCAFDLSSFWNSMIQYFASVEAVSDPTNKLNVMHALPAVMLFNSVFSVGGLLHYLGISAPRGSAGTQYDLDKSFDTAFNKITDALAKLPAGSRTFIDLPNGYRKYIYPTASSVRSFLYCALEYPDIFLTYNNSAELNDLVYSAILPAISDLITEYTEYDTIQNRFTVNLYKVIAYQMICAQYFTNDHVDDVYTSKLWLQNMQSLVYSTSMGLDDLSFSYNGVRVNYDVFSQHYLVKLLGALRSLDGPNFSNALYFFCNLFSFRRSLKYGDYFNSSRTQPLAVGDVTAPVVGNKVSAIDTTKSISYQRFLNAVNRAGSYIKDYVKSMFGVTPEQTEPMPNFLSRETHILGKDEIDNTADAQGNVVTNIMDVDSRFAFDIYVDIPSIILGLVTFDVVGCYQRVTEKDNFHLNRFDMFNPFLQNIGDQSVNLQELRPEVSPDSVFGYQVRNAEYKFKVNQCHGGFVYNLPSWLFKFDDRSVDNISSESIRSDVSDLDEFYKSLVYGSFAGYFHFIISMTNEVKSNRRMQFEPNIL